MSSVRLVWATPNADQLIAEMARVSNPANQANTSIEGLLKYMMRNGHVSPFEMASACVEINTTRDIGRQILRHRSFSFQEFSQRYASVDALPPAEKRECRLQDSKNRQNSLSTTDTDLAGWWSHAQDVVAGSAQDLYEEALRRGIAKEQARALLPEGLTPSRLYMAGTFRSWIHYLGQRRDLSTQKEHRLVAEDAFDCLVKAAPVTFGAFFP